MMTKFYPSIFVLMLIIPHVYCKKVINDEIVSDMIENVTIIKVIDMVDSTKDCGYGSYCDSTVFEKKVLNASYEHGQITSLLNIMKKLKPLRLVTKSITTYTVIINLKNMEPLQYDICFNRVKFVNELTYWYDENGICQNLLDSIFLL